MKRILTALLLFYSFFNTIQGSDEKIYNTLADLIKDGDLVEAGVICRTKGYYRAYDGGGACYLISASRPSSYYEKTDLGLYAQLIDNKHSVRCYGAIEGIDSSEPFQKAIDNNIGGYILIPEGRYIIGETIVMKGGALSICGEGDGTVITINKETVAFDISNLSTERLTIKDVCFEGKGGGTALNLGRTGYCLNTVIDHCVFRELNNAILLNKEVDNLTIRDCYFLRVLNGVYCSDISTNKSVIRITGNHFQMQRNGGVSVYLEMGSTMDISNNLFQAAQRKDITFMRLFNINHVNVSNNYLEISNSPDPKNNVGIEVNNLSGAEITQIRSQGYFHSIIRVLNSFSMEIRQIMYSPLGHKIPTIIENKPGQRVKRISLDISADSIVSSNGTVYIDDIDGVSFRQ